MGVTIHHNILAMNSDRMLGINRNKKAESIRKLSSGYKINKAADDAAGLAISEKMRRQIRGLSQGTENAADGVSWVQIGDGALEEAHEMLQRMNELSVKAMNGTNSAEDRRMIDDEFQHLKTELDRVNAATLFNEQKIFSDHKPDWYRCDGAVSWPLDQRHVIVEGDNDLVFKYREGEGMDPKTVSFTVPAGEYTTQELLDELDTSILRKMGSYDRWFEMEYDAEGHINAVLEGGTYIDSITGGLSYLMYDMYHGGGTGALLGTTAFPTETSRLNVIEGRNNFMSFVIEDLKGNQKEETLRLASGSYTREELIDLINKQMEQAGDTTVRAEKYGSGIKLGSTREFVTSFKGNMFRIDGRDFTSVFYDNVKYGSLSQNPAVFTGGYVLSGHTWDVEHSKFTIDGTNNTLTLQPDGRQDPVSLTIPPGTYTAWQMCNTLNQLFLDKDNDPGFEPKLGLTADAIYSASVPVGASQRATFSGIQITTSMEGPDSIVNIDPGCSAYNTLFVNREYSYYGEQAQARAATSPESSASVTGGRVLNDISPQNPFALTAQNNSFRIECRETGSAASVSDIITLTPKDYTDPDDLLLEIQNQLAASKCGGLVSASWGSGGELLLQEAPGRDISGIISVSAAPGSGSTEDTNGYRRLFVGITYPDKTVDGYGKISFDTPGKADSGVMQIRLGSSYTNVTLTNPADKTQIAEDIKNAFHAKTEEVPNRFTASGQQGKDNDFTARGYGFQSSPTPWSGSAQGTSGKTEGIADDKADTAAKLTLGPRLRDSMTLDNTNNQITLTLNGRTETLSLTATPANGTPYSPASLAAELQAQIDAVYGTNPLGDGALVTVENNHLVITTRRAGDSTNVSCSTGTSSFLADLNTTKYAASCSSRSENQSLQSSFTPAAGKTDFVLSYSDGSSTQDITLKLTAGQSYSPASLISAFNTQLTALGIGVKASLDGSYLKFTSDAKGNGVSLEFNTSKSSAADAMFGLKTPAQITLKGADVKNGFTIESGKQDFNLTVNGVPHKLVLDARQYTDRADFMTMLRGKLAAANTGVTASWSGSQLVFTTAGKGAGNTLSVSYDGSGTSAMPAIYGTSTSVTPGLKASWENNRLVLEAVKQDGTSLNTYISVKSSTSAGLLEPNKADPRDDNPVSSPGYHEKSCIQGVDMSKVAGADTDKDTVVIDQWNNNLQFQVHEYSQTGHYWTSTNVSATLNPGTYTYAQLASELEKRLGSRFHVTVDDSGVRIEAAKAGSTYYDSMDGSFYRKVMCEAIEKREPQGTADERGTQDVEPAYTLGRKDVTSGVEISRGFSDVFSFDLTILDQVRKIEVTLNPGIYTGETLRSHLQERIDEQLIREGLRPGLVKVGVGNIHSGVAGEVPNALNLSLDKEVQAPEEGDYVIDGVGGNAAFEIFYQTEGRIMPAYIMGTKDVRDGVSLPAGDTDLTFEVDGNTYDIQLAPGEYTSDEILAALNDAFTAGNVPLFASLNHEDGRVRVSYEELGPHEIAAVTGSAKGKIFFDETGGSDHSTRHVQLSSEIPDHIELKRSEFNARMLRIASLQLTGERAAAKATDRLGMAINRVSALRSDFGSTQNRLEHAINNNRNKEENLQYAESVIRDTDMADEMVRLSSLNILKQAITAVLSQANQQGEMVLKLLQ